MINTCEIWLPWVIPLVVVELFVVVVLGVDELEVDVAGAHDVHEYEAGAPGTYGLPEIFVQWS